MPAKTLPETKKKILLELLEVLEKESVPKILTGAGEKVNIINMKNNKTKL